MPRFNLTNILFAISLAGVCSGSAHAQVSAADAALVREHVNKGNFHMGRGAWEQAIGEYEAALDADPGSMVAKDNLVLVHNNWGISLFRQRKFDEAKAQWDEALKMNPYDRNAKQNLQVLKATLARINAAPKPPAKPAAEVKEAAGKSENPKEEAATSGGKVTGQSSKAESESSSGGKVLNTTTTIDESSSSGPKRINSGKSEESSSGPKIMHTSEDSSSGVKLIAQPGGAATSGAAIMVNPQSTPSEVPNVPAPPAVAPVTPEPPQVSAPPPIDLNSPYSFYAPTTVKPGAEVSSPYVMPTNLPAGINRARPYVAPNVVPVKPANEWKSPLPTAPEPTPAASAETEAASGNLEDQVAAIEIKLNGKKQKNMPILKRIEKLENSISGKTNSGSLQERIEVLKKSCGL